jgi:hypothetical protein
VRWFTPHARTRDELPLGRPELRLIDQKFGVDSYYSELFTVIGAIVARPIFKNPINPSIRFWNLATTGSRGWYPLPAHRTAPSSLAARRRVGAWRC